MGRRAWLRGALPRHPGGTIETFYYVLGDADLYVIADFPDHASMTALALTVSAAGRGHYEGNRTSDD